MTPTAPRSALGVAARAPLRGDAAGWRRPRSPRRSAHAATPFPPCHP